MDVREKLVDIVERASVRTLPKNTCHTNIVMLVNALIEEGVTVQQWIPVTERLPEESGQYIVCCNDSGCPYGEGIWYRSSVVVCAEVYVGIHGGICWEWREGSALYDLEDIVTHWMPMPMPQPPKGE